MAHKRDVGTDHNSTAYKVSLSEWNVKGKQPFFLLFIGLFWGLSKTHIHIRYDLIFFADLYLHISFQIHPKHHV